MMNLINICFLHHTSAIGGAERMSEVLISNFQNRADYRAFAILPTDGPFAEALRNNDCEVFILEFQQPTLRNFFKYFIFLRKVHKFIKLNNIHILHSADILCFRAFAPLKFFLDIRLLMHMHFPAGKPFVKWAFNKYLLPDLQISCSHELNQHYEEIFKELKLSVNTSVVHNGVDLKRFSFNQKNTNIVNVGIIANLQERKGHIDFIDMANILSNKGYHLHYHVIGGDILECPREDLLKSYVIENNLDEVFTFHGQVSDVIPFYQMLDLMICASHQEALPVCILEAQASGVPVISTNVNGIPEMISDNVNGFLVDAHSPEQLSAAVIRLLENPNLQQEFTANARTNVEQNFSVQSYLNNFLKAYQSLTNAPANSA